YYKTDPEFGNRKDFRKLIKEAHRRGIRIMMDLVLNHCSEAHPWFKHAIKSHQSHHRNWFVWKNAHLISADEKSHWHQPEKGPADELYYGFFWKGMPDFNFDEPAVRKAMKEVALYWIGLGVDALRLDAAMHIYPPGGENENTKWWQEFRRAIDKTGKEIFTVGEITESCAYIAPYLKRGLHSAFNFELAGHIVDALQYERHDCLARWLQEIQEYYHSVDESASDSIFLSNHDQVRIASRLEGHPAKLRLAASILMTLPGEVFLYYGEELGMMGEKPDEHLREPFPWSWADHPLQSRWIASRHNTPGKIKALDEQRNDSGSLYQHYRNLIQVRKSHPALIKGRMGTVECADSSLVLFTRDLPGQRVLVMHNLSGEQIYLKHEEEHVFFEILYGDAAALSDVPGRFRLEGYSSLIMHVNL
ncbi:MAG: DUF3459 domain-containing protein, partial [Bacteroidia bacterium]|nr:DUF3459 domain-containing protein [Bacteroidia bacterium]